MSAAVAHVCFRSPHGVLGVPVGSTRSIVDHEPLTPLPAPRPGVAGVLHADAEALVVLDLLGAGGAHILVLEHEGRRFGLLVEEVTDVLRIPADTVAGPPPGQQEALITATARTASGTILLVDVAALATRLDG